MTWLMAMKVIEKRETLRMARSHTILHWEGVQEATTVGQSSRIWGDDC